MAKRLHTPEHRVRSNVRLLRTGLKLSQRQLAELCGRQRSWVYRIEHSGRLEATDLRNLASALQLENPMDLVEKTFNLH